MHKRVIAVAAIAAISGTPTLADFEWSLGDNGGTFTFYGLFNPAIISVDDGDETETNLLDNDLAASRLGVRIMLPSGENTFRFRLESALGLPNSTEVDQFGSDYSRFDRTDIRHFDFSYGGNWGTVSLGQGSMVADGAAETDLSYVGTALYSYTADANASFIFRDSFDVLSGPVVADITDNFDGSRRGRIRYDSPSFNGFSVGVAYGENILDQDDEGDYTDIGLFYSGDVSDGVELAAALAYQNRDESGGDRSDILGSASVLLDNGFSFTFAAGDRDNDAGGASDPNYWYGKIAYEANWLSIGQTGIGLHYWDGSDFNVDGSDSEVWGIGIVQALSDYNVDFYLTYQEYEYDDDGDFEDISTIVFGALWSF